MYLFFYLRLSHLDFTMTETGQNDLGSYQRHIKRVFSHLDCFMFNNMNHITQPINIVIIQPCMIQSSNGYPSSSAILKKAATVESSQSS